MGVINLGLLIEKIKGKLESSGFIKNTDYATASATGVVQIGDNVDVSSAGVVSVPIATDATAGVVKVGDGLAITEAGVLSAAGSGGGFEQIYTEAATPVASSTAITLSKSSADYKALMIVYKRDGKFFNTWCSTVQNQINVSCGVKNYSSPTPEGCSFTPNGTTLTWTYNANAYITWYAVYGIK